MKLYSNDISVFADSNVITQTEFYQNGVALPDKTMAVMEQAYMPCNDTYIVGGVAVLFFLLVLVFFFQRSSYPYRIKAFFSNKRLYIEEGGNENGGGAISTFLLTSISVLCLTLIFFDNMAGLHGFDTSIGVPYWIIAVGYIACMLMIYVKSIVYGIVNWVFSSREASSKWTSGYFLATSLTALPLYPAALLYLFYSDSHKVVTASVIFIGILYELLLLYKLFVNFKTKEYGYLPLFLYFCSVELIPAIVICHTFDWINNFFIVKNLIY